MRYTHQFEIEVSDLNYIEWRKNQGACELGNLMREVIGFAKEECDIEGFERYRLEIQAFSQRDWMDFKREIAKYVLSNFPEERAKYEWMQFKTLFDRLENIGNVVHNYTK